MEEQKHVLSRVQRAQKREKMLRFSIRKYRFGAASVAIAALYLFLGRGAVYAAEPTPAGDNEPTTAETAYMEAEGTAETGENEGEDSDEDIQAALVEAKNKIQKATMDKLEAIKADKTLKEDQKKKLTESVQAASTSVLGLLESSGSDFNVAFIETLAERAVSSITDAEKEATDEDTTEEVDDETDEKATEESNATEDANSSEKPKESTPDTLAPKDEESAEKPKSEQPGEANQPSGESSDANAGNEAGDDAAEEGEESPEERAAADKALADAYDIVDKAINSKIAEVKKTEGLSAKDKEKIEAALQELAKDGAKNLQEAYQAGALPEDIKKIATEIKNNVEKLNPKDAVEETPAPKDEESAEKPKSEQPGEANQPSGESSDANAGSEAGDDAAEEGEEESDEAVQKTLDGLKDKINQTKDTIITAANEDKKASEEEKKAAVAAVTEWAKKAYEALDAAYQQGADSEELTAKANELIEGLIKSFEDAGEDELESSEVDRTEALKAIEEAKKAQEKAVDAREKELSKTEFEEAKGEIAKAAKEATEAIMAAETKEAVEKLAKEAVADIATINPVAKDLHYIKFAEAVQEATDKISQAEGLTKSDKEAAIKKLEAYLKEKGTGLYSDENPAYGDTAEDVKKEETKVLKQVEEFIIYVKSETEKVLATKETPKEKKPNKEEQPAAPTEDKLAKAKEAAKKEIAEELALVSANFESDETLSDNEKLEAKAGAKDVADQATQKVDEATTEEAVNEAKELGLTSLDNIYSIAIEESEAEITKAADAKKAEITANKNLSEAEQKVAIAQVDAAVKKATEAFSKVPTDIEDEESADKAQEGVDNAKTTALKEIESVKPIALDSLKAAVKKAQEDKLKEIQAATYLTAEERQKLESDVNTVATTTLKGFDELSKKGVTEAALTEIKNQAVDTIQSIEVPAAPKEEKPAIVDRTAALKAIDDAKTAQEKAIDARSEELSDTEVQAAKEEVEKSVAEAKKAINEAKTQEDVDKASKAGVADIATVNPIARDTAYGAMEKAVQDAKDKIDTAKAASEEEKKAAKAKLDALLEEKGNELYDEKNPAYGDTAEAVKAEEAKVLKTAMDFVATVDKIAKEVAEKQPAPKEEKPAMVDRTAALKAIEDAKTAQEKAVDERKDDLSEAEITAAKGEIAKSATAATKAINEAKTQEDVDKASKAGVADIATINPVPTDRVYESMEATVKEVTAQIDAVKGASKESKDAAKAKLTDLLKAQYDELYDEDRPAYVDTVEEAAKEAEKAVKRLTDFADKVLAALAEVKSAEADSSKPEDKPKTDTPSDPSKPEDKPKTDTPSDPSKPEDKPKTDTPTTPVNPGHTDTPTVTPRVFDDQNSRARVAGTNQTLAGVDHLAVEKVKTSVLDGKEYDAFDIELRDANNKAVQPHGQVTVSLPARKAVEAVYYIDSNNKLASLDFTQADGMVTFQTSHFSVYAVVYKADPVSTETSDMKEAKKEDKKELPHTGDKTPTVSFLVGLGFALMGMLALKRKEN